MLWHQSGNLHQHVEHHEVIDPDTGELSDDHIDAALGRVVSERPYLAKPAPAAGPAVPLAPALDGSEITAGQGIKRPTVLDTTHAELARGTSWDQVLRDAADHVNIHGNLAT